MSLPAVVSLVTLGVGDLARSVAFYEGLDWVRSSASVEGEIAFFRTAGPVLALYPRHLLAADAGLPSSGAGFRGVAFAINVASPEAVSAGLDSAVAAGGRLLAAATTAEWGGTSGYFADPDGHAWEVAHNPGFPQRPDGTVELPE